MESYQDFYAVVVIVELSLEETRFLRYFRRYRHNCRHRRRRGRRRRHCQR